jgi:hypothetical protein
VHFEVRETICCGVLVLTVAEAPEPCWGVGKVTVLITKAIGWASFSGAYQGTLESLRLSDDFDVLYCKG